MKIIISSDWHIDWRTAGVPRLPEVWGFVEEVAAACRDADLFVHLGDLRDPGRDDLRMSIELSRMVARVSAAAPAIWLAGNHDVVDRDGEPLTTLGHLAPCAVDQPEERGQFAVVEQPRLLYYWDVPVVLLPYPSRAAAGQWEEGVAEVAEILAGSGAHGEFLVFSHLCLPHMQPGEEAGEMGRGRDVFFPERIRELQPRAILNGHYHERCRYDWDGVEVVIPGSPARFTFGDGAPAKGFVVVEL